MPPNSSATRPPRPPLLPAITERQRLGLATALTALAGVAAIALVLVQLRHAHGPGPALAVLICVPVVAFGGRWPLPVLALASVSAAVQMAATRQITSGPGPGGARVLILTTFDLDEYVFEALRAGASGFALKSRPLDELLNAIRTVAAGEALLAPSVTRRLIAHFAAQSRTPSRTPPGLAELTEREREVLSLVAEGLSNAELARTLHVSLPTAKTHVSRILTKLGARDRTQLVILAYQSGLATQA